MGLYSQSAGTNLAVNATGLPLDGRKLYVRLWSLVGPTWQFNDYSALNVAAESAANPGAANLGHASDRRRALTRHDWGCTTMEAGRVGTLAIRQFAKLAA